MEGLVVDSEKVSIFFRRDHSDIFHMLSQRYQPWFVFLEIEVNVYEDSLLSFG